MINGADTAWLMMSSILVLMMTLPALGFFYGGLVQAKNILSVLFQCLAIAALVSLLWFAFVYSEVFSGTNPWIGDLNSAFLANVTRGAVHPGTQVPETVFVMFQMTFAIITPALIVGAYVERIRFGAVLLFSGLWLVIVYAPVAHWIWGGGFLATRGVMDFAGGIVVHLTAGLLGHRRRLDAWPTPRLSGIRPSAACAVDGDGRRLAVMGRLVRLQRRQCDQSGQRCRHDHARHASCRLHGHLCVGRH